MVRAGVVLIVFAVGACKRDRSPPPESGEITSLASDASIAQPGAAGGRGLDFAIKTIHRDQRLSSRPPFHEAGGTWIFFDATTADGVPFGFGFSPPKGGTSSFTFGDGILTTPDGATGKRLTASMARAFGGKIPAEISPQPIAPKKIGLVFLATDAQRAAGGFSGTGGGYYATKLFLQRPGIEAEVFFDFNLEKKSGELLEKDKDYADGVVAFVASELRDGPRPKRTPATDPSMRAGGPRIEWVRDLPKHGRGMSPARDRWWTVEKVDGGGERLVSLGFEREGDRIELLTVPHEFAGAECEKDICIATDHVPQDDRGSWSSNDPIYLFLVDLTKKTTTQLHGPWGEKASFPAKNALAPDGSFFIVTDYVNTDRESWIVDRQGKGRKSPVRNLDAVVSISKTQIVVRTGNPFKADDPTRQWLAVDPATLDFKVVKGSMDERAFTAHGAISPDGKKMLECRKNGVIVIREGDKERTFTVHPDDRVAIDDHCVSWASPRWIEYHGAVDAWLDVETMKLSPMGEPPEGTLEYDKDFRWVVDKSKDRARLGKITVSSD